MEKLIIEALAALAIEDICNRILACSEDETQEALAAL